MRREESNIWSIISHHRSQNQSRTKSKSKLDERDETKRTARKPQTYTRLDQIPCPPTLPRYAPIQSQAQASTSTNAKKSKQWQRQLECAFFVLFEFHSGGGFESHVSHIRSGLSWGESDISTCFAIAIDRTERNACTQCPPQFAWLNPSDEPRPNPTMKTDPNPSIWSDRLAFARLPMYSTYVAQPDQPIKPCHLLCIHPH